MDAVLSNDDLAAFLAREFPEARGISVERVTQAGLVARMAVGEGDLRPGGTISGPSIFALADVAVYLAVLSRIGPVALAVTTSATIDFLRKPAAGVDLRAEVRLLKLGRQLAVADALIYSDGPPDPVARASMTFSIPPAR
jgi:uncharacterized protein (TIGR00369 family)